MFKATNAGTGRASKILNPGTHLCRIADIKVETPPYDSNNRQILLVLEGVDQGDSFEGLAIDKEKPELGNFRGMVATVKHDLYDVKDFEWQGETIAKEQQIYNWVNKLARNLGVLGEMNANNVSGETIEEYVDQAKKYLANPDSWAYFTIAGKEYYKEGYNQPNYRLFLACKSMLDKEDRGQYKNKEPFILAEGNSDEENNTELLNDPKFIKFDPAVHIIKTAAPDAPAQIDNFSANGQTSSNSDLELP